MNDQSRLVFFLLLAAAFSAGTVGRAGAQPGTGDLESRVDSIFAERTGPSRPGAAIAVLQDGEIVLAKGYGTAHLEHGVPITPETRFHVASVSKQFTAYAVALLAERGALTLDDDIHRYLPELRDFGTPVTIRQLIHHTAGFRQVMRLQAIAGERAGELLTQEKALDLVWAHRELNFVPGTDYTYSNTHYTMLATIVERVTGEPFHDWMQEHVFQPLGMTQTLIVSDYRAVVPGRAEPYEETPEGYERDWGLLWGMYGGTGVHSTVLDLARWLRHLEAPPPEAASVVRQMHERAVLPPSDTLSYAFGLEVDRHRDALARVWHGGDGDGYNAFTGRYPEAGLGLVVLTNLGELSAYSTATEVADLYLEPWLDRADGQIPSREVASVPLDTLLLDALVGGYRMAPPEDFYKNEELSFWREGRALFLRPPEGGRIELRPTSDSTFSTHVAPVTMTFHRGPGGSVSSLTVHFPNEDRTAYRFDSTGFAIASEPLGAYAGVYYSPEIDTRYRLFVEDGRLLARHPAYQDFELAPTLRDAFDAEVAFFKWVRFERDEAGQITGFRVTNSNERVRNLWFEKRE